jgi:hypothetical protein
MAVFRVDGSAGSYRLVFDKMSISNHKLTIYLVQTEAFLIHLFEDRCVYRYSQNASPVS